MDGYALRAVEVADGPARLTVVEEITAGKMPRSPIGGGQASRIMTGAPIPPGADTVVIVERTRLLDDRRVHVEDSNLKAGQNILRLGREMRCGEVVLKAAPVLRP